jgi:hypothetical protein
MELNLLVMQTIETTNGIFKGQLIERNKLPKTAILLGIGYKKLEGRYNFDAFTEVYWYTTKSKNYLIIKNS